MQNQRGFVGVGVLIAILAGLALLGGGAYYVVQRQAPTQTASDNFDNVQTLPTTNNNQTQQNQPTKSPQITPAPSTSFLTIHGIYSLRAKPALEYLAFSLYAEGPNNPLDGVTQLFFNDESGGRPGVHIAPSGSSFGPIAGDLRPRTSCDLEIDVTVEIKNPVFEARSGESIGNYRVVSGDFVRVVKRGQVTDVCSVDNGHGGTTLERTPRVSDTTPTLIPGIIRIASPNGGDTLKIGDTVRVSWDAKKVPGKYVGLRLEVWQISGDKPIIDAAGQCANCIGGGMITLSNPVSSDGLANGAGSVDWKVGEKLYPLHTPPGPGNNYVLMAVAERGNTDAEAAECRQKNPGSVMCGKPWTVELGRDYSDRVFSITN